MYAHLEECMRVTIGQLETPFMFQEKAETDIWRYEHVALFNFMEEEGFDTKLARDCKPDFAALQELWEQHQ